MAQNNNKQQYYVPVTRRVAEGKENDYAAIIDELVKVDSSIALNDFNPGVKLITNPKLQDGNLTLNFNENIFVSR